MRRASVTAKKKKTAVKAMDTNLEKVIFAYVRSRTDGESNATCIPDLCDGVTLNILAEKVTGIRLKTWQRHPTDSRQRKENTKAILSFLKDTDIDTCKLKTEHIFKEDPRTLVLIENLFKFDVKKQLCGYAYIDESMGAYEALQAWINEQIAPRIQVNDLKAYWATGKPLAALVETMAPGKLADWPEWNEARIDSIINITKAMAAAHSIGIHNWLRPEDMSLGNHNETCNALYLFQFVQNFNQNMARSPTGPAALFSDAPMMRPGRGRGGEVRGFSAPFYSDPSLQPGSMYKPGVPIQRPASYNQVPGWQSSPKTPAVFNIHEDIYPPELYAEASEPGFDPDQIPQYRSNMELGPQYRGKTEQGPIPHGPGQIHRTGSGYSLQRADQNSRRGSDSSERSGSSGNLAQQFSEAKIDDQNKPLLTKTTSQTAFWKQLPPQERKRLQENLADVTLNGELRLMRRLQYGTCCEVYKARFNHPEKKFMMVAAKTLSGAHSSLSDIINTLSEANLMKDFTDDRVMKMVCLTFYQGLPAILLPLQENGDLQTYLTAHAHPNGGIHERKMRVFCEDIAAGMMYLHESVGLVHQNLSTSHCLLDEDFRVKIFDFSCARETFDEEYVRVSDLLTDLAWWRLAPEIMGPADGEKAANYQTDVWSYGILLCVVYHYGEELFPQMGDSDELLQYFRENHVVQQPQGMPDMTYNIALKCLNLNPEKRPSFKKLVELLDVEKRMSHGYETLHHDEIKYANLTAYDKTVASTSGTPV